MESVRTLIVGAGMSGLSTAAFLHDKDYLVIDRDDEIGGYCKTVKQDGFVWDYSGHFFHFKHPEIETYLRERMPKDSVRSVEKSSLISYKGERIDFPFQKNIHQLPKDEFIECLVDLYFARTPGADAGGSIEGSIEQSFKDMLYARFGRGIAEKFLIPYNEKLYACDLGTLDKDAMGRFFPHANLTDIIRNMREPDNATYNARFTYPEGGAIEYVKAIASEVVPRQIALREELLAVDVERRVATTTKRVIRFDRLISSAPFNKLLQITGISHDRSAFSWNKVLVFNLGFDRKGPSGVHWIYYPDRARAFYRVGFYDNILETDRMSLYVELGFPANAKVDVDAMRRRTLEDLRSEGVITDHQLVASHSIVLDPAYVHITKASMREHERLIPLLREYGIHSIGRYGGWTYCSIEDNIIEARSLANSLAV